MRLYIHIPFCIKKCNYCDFLSYGQHQGKWCIDPEEYVSALIRSIQSFPPGNTREINSVFVGGGTPSCIKPELMDSIMETIRAGFDITDNAECTIESNPGTLNRAKLTAYRKMGFNRLSMGVQSFDDGELRCLGRIHDRNTAIREFHLAREVGFENINLDLISAIPGQTVASWKRTLEHVIALHPEHISAYSLILEEGTPFGNYYSDLNSVEQRWPDLPSEEAEREMYDMTGEMLFDAGYGHYEISNYALPGKECLHNIAYWTGEEYLGIGLGASSFLKGEKESLRFTITQDPEQFLTDPNHYVITERINKEGAMEEYMILGLRMMKGISLSEFENRFGKSIWDVYGTIMQKQVDDELLVIRRDRAFLSKKGIAFANRVMADYLL